MVLCMFLLCFCYNWVPNWFKIANLRSNVINKPPSPCLFLHYFTIIHLLMSLDVYIKWKTIRTCYLLSLIKCKKKGYHVLPWTDKTLLTAKEKLDRAYNTAFTRGIDLTKLRVWQKLVQWLAIYTSFPCTLFTTNNIVFWKHNHFGLYFGKTTLQKRHFKNIVRFA